MSSTQIKLNEQRMKTLLPCIRLSLHTSACVRN